MSRIGCIVLVVAAATIGVACGHPDVSEPGQDLLFLSSPGGVAVVEPGAAVPSLAGRSTMPSRDWSTVVRTKSGRGITGVEALDPASEAELWKRNVPGNLKAKLVSEDGKMVALGPTREPAFRDGRSSTRLVVASEESDRTFVLKGNFEPEAFSTDGRSLFVIRYLPPTKPARYQVRRLDMTSGRVVGVYTPDAHLQRSMGGTARVQAASSDGRRLYTLYTLRGADGRRYAFVHVLSLDELWAHCIHLPAEFARSAEVGSALAVTPEGDRLFVANERTDAIAEIDTKLLGVRRTAHLAFGVASGRTHAALGSNETLYLASGRRVTAVSTSTLREKRYWLMPGNVRGLQVTSDATKLYVGWMDRVSTLDLVTGDRLQVFDPPGVKRIAGLGPVQRLPQEDDKPEEIVCAC